MSFSIYVSTMNNDDENMFDRSVVERAFRDISVDQTGGYWNLRSPDGRIASTTIFLEDKPNISGFSANRPPSYSGFPKFWNAMFEILSQTHAASGERPTSKMLCR